MIVRDIPWRPPYAAFAPLEGEAHAHLLHGGDAGAGGWSMIVASPVRLLRLERPEDAGPWLAEVEKCRRDRQTATGVDAPFCSGLVGYIGYEALAALEPSLKLPESPYALPLAQFGVYNAAAVFHREAERVFIAAHNETSASELEDKLGARDAPSIILPEVTALTSNFSRDDYLNAVSEIIERIGKGDFFQANIAQTLTAVMEAPLSPFALFRKVSAVSDAFFAALFQFDEGAIVSNSPERFFRLSSDGAVLSEPIKGTRPRGRDGKEDQALAAALLADPKDRAENVMIADLMRNDFSRICRDHSIKEDAICALMTLSRVHHLVSRISGVLRSDAGIHDVFRALFPCGSITGAPKIEAMKTIAEIEGVGRGPYCGAIGYIDDRGRADFAVAIRTMIIDAERRRVAIPIGGGVTLRSDPVSEYDETLVKARAALSALGATAEDL